MTVLEAAVATSVLFVVIVLASLAYNPRLWIQDFPEEMQAEMEPLSRGERIAQALVAVLLLAVVIGIPLVAVSSMGSSRGDLTVSKGFLYVWLILMVVNLVDLVIIDWLIGVWWQPAFLFTPETEPLRHHVTYRFHVVEHVKGTVMLTVLALVMGGLVSV